MTEEGDEQTQQLIIKLNSLISLSSSIKTFSGKWQSIRNILNNILTTMESSLSLSILTTNPSFEELVSSTATTVDEAETLAAACGTFSGGKLLMKSNLDCILSKFHLHSQTLSDLVCHVASIQRAIVLSKPPMGAQKEVMAIYLKDLYQRMKLTDIDLVFSALSSLNEVLAEDENYARIAAVDSPEIAGTLILLLSSETEEIQHLAAKAVSLVAEFKAYRPILALAGAVNGLVSVLERGSLPAKERALTSLKKLTENSDNAWAVSAQGGVTAALRVCADGDSGGEILSAAAGVVKNLLPVKEIRRFMVDQGAVRIFFELASSTEEVRVVHGLELIQELTSQDLASRKKMIEEKKGFVELLVQSLGSNSTKVAASGLRIIDTLSLPPGSLLRAGFLWKLLLLLRHSEGGLLEAAVATTTRLASDSDVAQRKMGQKGFMRELTRLLRMKSWEGREMAALGLARIMTLKRNQKKFLEEEDDGVEVLLCLLGPEETSSVKKAALAALLAVSCSGGGRRRIAESDQIQRLEKLAELEMGDAKKILRRVCSGRLWSRFAGIFGP